MLKTSKITTQITDSSFFTICKNFQKLGWQISLEAEAPALHFITGLWIPYTSRMEHVPKLY